MHFLFPFSIVHMSYLGSSIPSNIYYASVDSEILRFIIKTYDNNAFCKTF